MVSQRLTRLEPDQLSTLWHACNSNDTTSLAHLIEALDPTDIELNVGLFTAIEGKHLDMVRYLLERGASADGYAVETALRARSIPALDMLREYGWDVNMKLSEHATTALSLVTHDQTLVSYLLKLGANPNLGPGVGPGVGCTAMLHLIPNSGRILQSAAQYGTIETFDMLIAHGAVLSNAAALHAAVEGGNVDMMARVLELGADVDEPDGLWTMGPQVYCTPLLRAIEQGKIDAVRFLLEKGASTVKMGRRRETALQMVKNDWVVDEIRKMVEEVGERGNGWPGEIEDQQTEKGRDVKKECEV